MPLLARITAIRALRPLPWLVVGYVLAFLLLDWASFIRPLQGLNITPWNPQPALAVALLLASRRLWWLVLAGLVAAEVLVRGVPGDMFVVVVAAAALTCSYTSIAAAIERAFGSRARLSGGSDVARLLGVLALGSLLSAMLYVGVYAAGGYLPDRPAWEAVARYWIGDAVGLTVVLPILMLLSDPLGRSRLLALRHARTAWASAALALLLPGLLLGDGGVEFDFSYLLLLPVVWAALRFGVPGAVLASALLQLGVIVAVQLGPHRDLLVFELQLLMVALSTTALLLGVVVDERARADAELRRSLRLAAAGQMTAALAHELSQPLNALALYAESFRLLAEGGATTDSERGHQLRGVVQRMAADAERAGDVVRRLRDFFRSGATQLERCALSTLVDEALAGQRARAEAVATTLRTELPPELPALWVDAVQLQVVLRNLLTNALDAATGAAARQPIEVLLRATVQGREVRIEVLDSGPGLDAQRVHSVFEPNGSDKAAGMGVGLGICRAIVEAHGGRLWALPGERGHFCFTLPLDLEAEAGATAHAG